MDLVLYIYCRSGGECIHCLIKQAWLRSGYNCISGSKGNFPNFSRLYNFQGGKRQGCHQQTCSLLSFYFAENGVTCLLAFTSFISLNDFVLIKKLDFSQWDQIFIQDDVGFCLIELSHWTHFGKFSGQIFLIIK